MRDYVCAILLLIRSAHSAPQLREQAETDWSPITTPDDWIRIQSTTTEKFPQSQESTAEPITESTIQSSTSAQPMTESTILHDTTERPTMVDLLSTIATVTINTELPVPKETLNMSDYKQVCGRRLFPQPRIVGGNPSSLGKWPWQLSLGLWRYPMAISRLCGAALLNENWAITAAHCVDSISPTELLLRFGLHDLGSDEPYGYQERRVHIVAIHPQYNSSKFFTFDLALLRFSQPLLPFQPNVLPICLPDDDETYTGRTAYVTGWGSLYDAEGPYPSVLQEVALPVINNSVCGVWAYGNAGYINIPQIPQIYICTGYMNGGFGHCYGDSGSPMVIQRARDKRWILAGIVHGTATQKCDGHSNFHMRISVFREWIDQILQF